MQPYGETGYSIGGSDTAGESYNEFSLGNVSAYRHNYPVSTVRPRRGAE